MLYSTNKNNYAIVVMYMYFQTGQPIYCPIYVLVHTMKLRPHYYREIILLLIEKINSTAKLVSNILTLSRRVYL